MMLRSTATMPLVSTLPLRVRPYQGAVTGVPARAGEYEVAYMRTARQYSTGPSGESTTRTAMFVP